jgi:hypothetical protein
LFGEATGGGADLVVGMYAGLGVIGDAVIHQDGEMMLGEWKG